MENNNLELWNSWKQPPKNALKEIKAGRMKGKHDINPQWRIQALTEKFGACGIGWYYTIDKLWNEQGANNEIMCFAQISLYIRDKNHIVNKDWGMPIVGIGGNKIIMKEERGMHNSDEGYKMAVTDAISVACKMLGIAADIYLGNFDGAKYKNDFEEPKQTPQVDEKKELIFEVVKIKTDLITKGYKFNDEQLNYFKEIESGSKSIIDIKTAISKLKNIKI